MQTCSPSSVLALRLCCALVGRQMVARLRICARTWLPKELAQPLAGSVETWQFRHWRDWPTKPRRRALRLSQRAHDRGLRRV